MAVHYGSLFVLPAFLYLVDKESRQSKIRWSLFSWCLIAGTTVFAFIMLIYTILPHPPGADPLVSALLYIRGLGPGVAGQSMTDPTYLGRSTVQLLHRLFSQDVPHLRQPPPSFPTGVTWLHAVVAISGVILAWRRNRRFAIFWLLYSLPYLSYEVVTGDTPDFGAYVVFFVPAMASLTAYALVKLYDWPITNHKRSIIVKSGTAALAALLLFPSILHFVQHWRDRESDWLAHYLPWVLAEIAAAPDLPAKAVLIQPKAE